MAVESLHSLLRIPIQNHRDWYDQVVEERDSSLEKIAISSSNSLFQGVYTEAGFGDGKYSVFVAEQEGVAVMAALLFIEDGCSLRENCA